MKRIKNFLMFIALSLLLPVYAQNQMPYVTYSTYYQNVIFVNGIQNDFGDTLDSSIALASLMTFSPNHKNSPIIFTVHYIYNPIGFYGSTNGLDFQQDLQGLGLLKIAEEHYIRDLEQIVTPYNNPNAVVNREAAGRVSLYAQRMTPGGNSLETQIPADAMHLTQEVVHALTKEMQNATSAIVIAHSEGNLLANLAYARLARDFGEGVRKKIRVINVANTSRVAVSGLNFTHANDGALFAAAKTGDRISLEKLPSSGNNWTRTTPECRGGVCDFILAPPTFSGVGATSIANHNFAETYLGEASTQSIVDQGITFTPHATRMIDRFEDILFAAAYDLEAVRSNFTRTMFFDDFNNGFDNTSRWNYFTTPHREERGYMRMWSEEGMSTTISPHIPRMNIFTLYVRHIMHTQQGQYYVPQFRFILENGIDLAVVWQKSTIPTETCSQYSDKVLLVLAEDQMTCHGASVDSASSFEDTPLFTSVSYNAFTGEFSLDFGNDGSVDLRTILPPEKRASIRSIYFGAAEGKGNAGYHAFGDVRIMSRD